MSAAHQIDDQTLTLLRNGEEYFPRLVAAINDAARSVYLETYIFAGDATGHLIAGALQRAAQRGAVVRLLLDGFGSSALPPAMLDDLRAAGVEVLWFRPEIARFKLRRYRLRRLHRKLAVVDGQIAFVGGINIEDDVPGGPIAAPRLDYAVEVRGDTAERIHQAVRRLWLLVQWTNFRRQREREQLKPAPADDPQQKIAFLLRDNLRHRRDIEQAYLEAIAGARREIVIANAYFLPGRVFRHALLQAARRGVRVILLLQGKVEYRLQHYAMLALYSELLGAGVEIHEYRASYLHAKVAVVDGCWATVGSSNIDPFSLWLGREANLVVRDAGFAGTLRASLSHEIALRASLVTHIAWRRRGLAARLLMRASYGIVRLLTGLIGYARGSDDV
ncbi:MAG: putative cardiolipin synthase [Gallionellaceae bacterium]|nr:MAG: putative cardiolipin synthase [Gallionellaceae bacterium]